MGKTTTANIFRDLGYKVFDADAAVHKLYEKGGAAVPLINAVFPDAVKNGSVDRTLLGRHMRSDPLNLQVLESFIHPMVSALRSEFIEAAKQNQDDIIIFDVPLLFETGGHLDMDAIIVVTAPEPVQKMRVLSRPGMTEVLFEKLLSRQMKDSEKRRRADYLIFTDKGLDSAREQVQIILKKLKAKA